MANISVKIDEPALSRSIPAGDYTSGNTAEVTLNSIRLSLSAQVGSKDTTFLLASYDNRQAMLDAIKAYQFTGVRNPISMDVYINTNKESGWTLNEVYNVGLAAPLYDTSSTFTPKDDTDGDGIDEYEVALAPAHTIARLEFGGIKHVDTKDPCLFSKITLDGMLMNNVEGLTPATEWDDSYLLASPEINEAFTEAVEGIPSWPANNQCYGFNILPTTDELPVLTVCFSDVEVNQTAYPGTIWGNADKKGYATVKNYILDEPLRASYGEAFGCDANGVITKFPAGYIYQVKDLSIPDEAVGPTINGGEDAHIYAVITVEDWTVVTGTVEWN